MPKYRPAVYILLFLFFFNASIGLLDDTGTSDYLGIEFTAGDADELSESESTAEQFETGTGEGQTLLGTYNRLADVLNGMVNAVQPGKEMLEANGVPASITGFLWSGMGLIIGWDIARFIRRG